ncbi:DUF7684 family protein [Psychrobacter sp. I-STPA10]|uniref:DUF7684 family protein n=1 Tax=Psychrobacter sp. I-STPA10 TaxID=2585769 RepID=UPI001E52B16C|nr:hypothetical protein [Psychrobacter sp. I-STPA10]
MSDASMINIKYHAITKNGFIPPVIDTWENFKVAIILDKPTDHNLRNDCIHWLVHQPCYYVLTWGIDCELWEDWFDETLVMYNIEHEIKEKFVMTTSHQSDTANEFIDFVIRCATHPNIHLKNLLILHITNTANEKEILSKFTNYNNHKFI